MGNYGKGNLKIKIDLLYNNIIKFREKTISEIEEYQRTGKDISLVYEDSYNGLLNLYECYNELYKHYPKNEAEYEEVNWFFNDGKLRSDEEIFEHQQFLEQEKARAELPEKLMKINTASDDIFTSSICSMFFLLPTILYLLYYFSPKERYGEPFDVVEFLQMYPFAYLFGIVIMFAIVMIIAHEGEIDFHYKRVALHNRAGVKPPVDKKLIASSISLGLSLAGTFLALRNKKDTILP